MSSAVVDLLVYGLPVVIGGLLMGKYYGKKPKDEDTDKKDE